MNKVIEVTENDVKAAFQAAKTDEMKEVLAALFCKREAPTLDNYKTIKSYEDACEALGVYPIQPEKMNVSKHIVALMKLETISKALWGKDFDPKPDPKGEKCFWYPYFALYTQDEIEGLNEAQRGALLSAASSGTPAGFGCLVTAFRSSFALAALGFRLCQETEEKAQYFGTQFIELWAEYLSYNFTTGERIK